MKSHGFEKLGWKHPYSNEANLIDFLNAIYKRLGINDVVNNENSEKLLNLIPVSKNYVFILIDGMGYNLLKKALPDSFLTQNIKLPMNTIFPSSTGTVLTSLATALLPEKHAINGWFSYQKSNDECFMTLPFKNRFDTNIPLKTSFDEVFFANPLFKNLPVQTNAIMNKSIANTTFTKWSLGYRDLHAYSDFIECFDILGKLINENHNSFNYVYIGEYDGICHKYGSDSSEATSLLAEINSHIEKFSLEHSSNCTTMIVADHGQVTIDPSNFNVILSEDSLCKYFYAPPSGDTRFSSFYVKSEFRNQFEDEFNSRFGQQSILMSIDEVEKEGLLGSNGMEAIARERFGDYIAIWKKDYAFKYSKEAISPDSLDRGNHGGLTKYEMEVPLIIF